MKNLSVIIPFYNEKEFLEISVKRVTDLEFLTKLFLQMTVRRMDLQTLLETC